MDASVQQMQEEYSKVYGATFQNPERQKMVHAIRVSGMRPTDIILEAFAEWFARRFPEWK